MTLCAGKFFCRACRTELVEMQDLPENLEEAADAPWCSPAQDEFRSAEQLLGSFLVFSCCLCHVCLSGPQCPSLMHTRTRG